MSKQQTSLDLILKQAMLPLFFHPGEEVSIHVLKALYSAGIRSVEYTNRGPEALGNFKKLLAVKKSEMKDLQLGIGTIKNKESAAQFIEAGADYLVSPGYIAEVGDIAGKNNILWIPGCMTSSEIIAAENAGVKFIKLFPGNILGPAFMSSIKDIFPDIYFMPTGGVDLTSESIGGWFKSGVSAVGMGSKLITKELLEQKNYTKIETLTKEALSLVASLKK
ncbi:bifunctional 4-hydroxy-2-oxoglutarate aldolase/2-dehydro-3-deoxy-phosphogluconate aldolase [Sphingobacteriaceae bacterium]|nr:bifunctional 4-hydroxy-2-oxoglutarate aldolase/2-dehydro-3-deoxy-phosphogluconate aldolase [Sphingobacteriaceae bacterium]